MTSHRFIHIGDLHLGPKPRNTDRLAALDQVVNAGLVGGPLYPVDAWLWPGDLNDGRMTINDRNALAERLVKMAEVAPVVVAYGNHDLPGDLDVFAKLKTRWPIRVIATPQTISVALRSGGQAAIFVLPYPMKAGLVAAGVVHQDLGAAARLALEAIFHVAAASLENARAMGYLPLMIGHVNVAGSITSSGQPNIGQEIEVDEALLDMLGPCYKGLNHIHKAQQIAGAFYAGSCCRLDWGETEEKRFLEIQIADDQKCSPAIYSHSIDVAPMYHVEGELRRDRFDWQLIGEDAPHDGAAISWKGCEVRVRYRFAASEKTALSTSRILAEFADAKRLELQPVAVPDKALRAPEVAAAVTLPEKFIKYCELGGSEATPGMLDKLAQVEQTAPVLVLRAVATAIAEIEAEDVAVLV